jgi:hypothetical protein
MGKTDLCNCEEVLSTCCGAGSNEFVDTFCDACNEWASFECADCGEGQP